MKFVTPALMNETQRRPKGIRGLFFKPELQDAFYQARHRERELFLVWIEANRLGSLHTFPSVLQDGESIFIFGSARDREWKQRQEAMLQRWNEVVDPKTVRSEFEVTRLTEVDFDLVYAEYRRRYEDRQETTCEQA